MASGTVTLDNRPIRGADVLRIDGVTPTALVHTDATGAYELPDSKGDRVVVRVRSPIVGAWIADAATTDFKLSRDELVRVEFDFRLPEGASFDWLDVMLTPRREEAPPRVILAAGVEPGLSESMYAIRINEPRLVVEVRAGLYDLRAHRVIYDAPKDVDSKNLMADHVVTDGPPAVPRFGGFEVELGQAKKLAIALRYMKRGET
jgi:hypothetical protein